MSNTQEDLVRINWINNVTYNSGGQHGRSGFDKGPQTKGGACWNYINNHIVVGPSTYVNWGAMYATNPGGGNVGTLLYVSGNKVRQKDGKVVDLERRRFKLSRDPNAVFRPSPFSMALTHIDPARVALQRVQLQVGATQPRRDKVDARVVNELKSGTGRLINWADFYANSDVGELKVQEKGRNTWRDFLNREAAGELVRSETYWWPDLANTQAPPPDTDGDGMPDAWETAHGLDPGDPEDGSRFDDSRGISPYTNLEVYLQSLCVGRRAPR